jgi:anti-sigma factor RsiW
MKDEPVVRSDDQLEAYVLGTLPETELQALEDEVFADDAAFERLQMIEERLLERYADGELDADRRARVEARLLSTPEGRRRLAMTRALDAKGRASAPPWWRRRWVFGAAGLSAAVTAAILLVVALSPAPSVVTLAPSVLRSAAPPKIAKLTPPSLSLRLELDPAAPVPADPRAQLLASGFDRTWKGTVVEGTFVSVELPTATLRPGVYEIRLLDGASLTSTYVVELREPRSF